MTAISTDLVRFDLEFLATFSISRFMGPGAAAHGKVTLREDSLYAQRCSYTPPQVVFSIKELACLALGFPVLCFSKANDSCVLFPCIVVPMRCCFMDPNSTARCVAGTCSVLGFRSFHCRDLCYYCWYTSLKWCVINGISSVLAFPSFPFFFGYSQERAIQLAQRCISTCPPRYYASYCSIDLVRYRCTYLIVSQLSWLWCVCMSLYVSPCLRVAIHGIQCYPTKNL
ncbi:hypothetical protein DFS33DRAFT_171725 [Desarmillaria ectypa]|nr:hypothetical protein DFS33DRAFT_171725 [Desarmillaria ectypa]